MITSKQMLAARAVLGLSRYQFSQIVGIDKSTIQRLEGSSGGLAETRDKIQAAFERQGIEFPRNGERKAISWVEEV